MWRGVSLADAISPDANGATLDSQPLLSGPITQATDGGFTFPIIGGAVQTDPALGAIFAFTPRDNDGKIVTDAPMAFGMRAMIRPGGAADKCAIAQVSSSLITLATGAYNTQALKTTNLDLTALPVAFFGVFGSGVLGAASPKISVEYFYTALPAGTRL